MARQTHRKITKRNVKTLVAGGKLGVYWYATLPGFGVRLYASWGGDAGRRYCGGAQVRDAARRQVEARMAGC